MDKKTKMLLGVGVLGVGAYLLYQSQKKKSFANYMATTVRVVPQCKKDKAGGGTYTDANQCKDGCFECCGQGVFGLKPAGVVCPEPVSGGAKDLRVGRVGRMG